MAHAKYLREKARSLRTERKLTIDELAERLALSRSTIYYWVRDLPIPGSGSGGGWPEGAREKGTRAMQRKYRLQREAAYREGLEVFEALVAEPTFRDFVCLYVAEGYKRDRNRVAICNSSPVVMKLANYWMCRLTDRRLRYSIHFHADQDTAALTSFWGAELGISPDVISLQRKSNSGQMSGRVWRCKHGVITVATDDTSFRARLQAWIDCQQQEWLDFVVSGA